MRARALQCLKGARSFSVIGGTIGPPLGSRQQGSKRRRSSRSWASFVVLPHVAKFLGSIEQLCASVRCYCDTLFIAAAWLRHPRGGPMSARALRPQTPRPRKKISARLTTISPDGLQYTDPRGFAVEVHDDGALWTYWVHLVFVGLPKPPGLELHQSTDG